MSQLFRTRRRVEFADTDMAGIAHFSAFFLYMESAEHELLRSLGASVHTPLADGVVLSFPRVSASCDYRSPAKCEEELDIAVGTERLGEKSIRYRFEFTRAGQAIATGRMTSVCCKFMTGQPPQSTPIPTEFAARLAKHIVGDPTAE